MIPRPNRLFDYREYPVLYVDDEPENLRIFELAFRRDFGVLTAPDAASALRIINERPVSVALSDQRMPGMTGVEFLARVREVDPKIIRILVTAYGDAQTLGSAVNDGSIYKYIPKPWTPEDMELSVRRAVEVYALDRERDDLLLELTTLNQVSQSINQQLELSRLLDLILETLTDTLHFDSAAILFFREEQGELAVEAVRPRGDTVNEWVAGLSFTREDAPGLLKKIAQAEMQVLRFEDVADYEAPIRAWVHEVAADEILIAPLLGKEAVIGALVVDNRRGGKDFGVAEQTLMDGLATQAVIAIENARLVEDLRSSREQVVRADRLGTLGTLAAGLAHEINNPLTSIHTFLSLAPTKREDEDPEFWQGYHALATREVDRIRGLVASMERLASGGGGDVQPEWCVAGELGESVARLLAREAGRVGVRLELERDDDAPDVYAVRDQLHQVLLNLLLNAIHACAGREDGCVVLRVLQARVDEEDGLAFEVEDNGPGIPTEALERLFDPFFTTKGPDQGTGLGLTICQQLIANHDGSIEVRSRDGEGALFRVLLPRGGVGRVLAAD